MHIIVKLSVETSQICNVFARGRRGEVWCVDTINLFCKRSRTMCVCTTAHSYVDAISVHSKMMKRYADDRHKYCH